MYKAIGQAGDDLVKEIGSTRHLYPYMPNHYADELSRDLSVRVYKRGGKDAHVTIRAEGRTRKRKLVQLDQQGILVHPVFGRGLRSDWIWREQFRSVRPGFFTDPVEEAAPEIRRKIEAAMRETARKITGG